MKKSVYIVFFTLLTALSSLGQELENHLKIKVFNSATNLSKLAEIGILPDHESLNKDSINLYINPTEYQALIERSIPLKLIISNVENFYQSRSKNAAKFRINNVENKTEHFTLGSMGGFQLYTEMNNHLTSMTSSFPHLIHKDSLPNKTHENRTVYFYRISENPSEHDSTKASILFDALIHAREPVSLSSTLYTMWYLLEQYSSNSKVKSCIQKNNIYFVPCINPDGYIKNNTEHPDGGGMWRKNLANNGDGTLGVDLNRNYGYEWGHNNKGSSSITSSSSYRGTHAFSEPETQNMKWLCETYNMEIALNYHSYGDLLIYPWGFDHSLLTPDSILFENQAFHMVRNKAYSYGTGNETIGYITNGDSDDWMYGEQSTKNKILSYTPELGNDDDGFYPSPERIIPICNEALDQNIKAIKMLQPYFEIEHQTSPLIDENYSWFKFKATNISTNTINKVDIAFTTTNIKETHKNITVSNIQSLKDSFQINDLNLNDGDTIYYDLAIIYNNDTFTYSSYLINAQEIIKHKNFSFQEDEWFYDNEFYLSAPNSISNTNSSKYLAGDNTSFEFDQIFNLDSTLNSYIVFDCFIDIETNFDYAQLQIKSKHNDWTTIESSCSRRGTANQKKNNWVIDGRSRGWKKCIADLSNFKEEECQFRFTFKSDYNTNWTGINIDNISLIINDEREASIEDSNQTTLKIHPNPSNSIINIRFHENTWHSFSLINRIGQTLHKGQIETQSNALTLNLNQLIKGIFYIQLEGDNQIIREAIVIQ